MVHLAVKSSLFLSLVLVFLLFDSSSNASKVVEVDAICNNTSNPSFCSKILNSKPGGAKGADLATLANYTIEVARANITNTIKLIKSLIRHSASDPKAKDHYKKCLGEFGKESGALGEIEYAEQLLKARDYPNMQTAATDVSSDALICVSPDGANAPYKDHSFLPNYADVVIGVAGILLIISDYLMEN